ncbi:hypothetical protein DYY67_2008 [Candidatus Nitrosotalea sp. TS]|nr:hypothetical protein [Candidatus Nitrosotalea sp. TS]
MLVDKTVQILIECHDGRKQDMISRSLGWKEGATGTAIRRLVEKGLLEKTERGTYRTTEKGSDYIAQCMKDYEEQESRRIDFIVYNAYRFPESVLQSSTPYISMFTGIIDLLHIDKSTRAILGNIKKIYTNAVDAHLKDELVIAAMWADHAKPVCIRHKFDYAKSYDAYASEKIQSLCSREQLFTVLHRYSRVSLSLKRYWIKK